MSSRDDGAPAGDAVMQEVRPELLFWRECDGCLLKRFGVRTYVVAAVAKRDLCPRCAKAMGAELVAPEATTPSIVDIAAARVELVEARLTHPEQLAAAVGAGRAPEGDLPYTWPDPEVCS